MDLIFFCFFGFSETSERFCLAQDLQPSSATFLTLTQVSSCLLLRLGFVTLALCWQFLRSCWSQPQICGLSAAKNLSF